MFLKISTRREVWNLTAAITATAVLIPLVIVTSIFIVAGGVHDWGNIIPFIAIAGLIPLFVTPPLAFAVLEIFRVQAEMIRTIDARIMYDMLTGVLNRNHFLDSVRAANVNGPFLIIDADHFKMINDRNGHAVGDEALRIMANAIQQCIGKDGFVGRLGGEEFGVFLPGKTAAEGVERAESIRIAVRSLSPLVAGNPVRLSVSIGCGYHRATRVIGHSMKVADDLLYRAKAGGRNRVAYELPKKGQRKSI